VHGTLIVRKTMDANVLGGHAFRHSWSGDKGEAPQTGACRACEPDAEIDSARDVLRRLATFPVKAGSEYLCPLLGG
jgi:hypothetical protein